MPCLLPVPYFHVVFTLPHGLNPLIAQNRRALRTLLFESVSATRQNPALRTAELSRALLPASAVPAPPAVESATQ